MSLTKINLILVFTIFLISPNMARAATYIVDSTNDTVDANPGDGICADSFGNCTLRAAIDESNNNPPANPLSPNVIELADQTYAIALANSPADLYENNNKTGDFDIKAAVVIRGAQGGNTIISGSEIDRVFQIQNSTAHLGLFNLTIQDGWAIGSEWNYGHAIQDDFGSNLAIINSHIYRNGNPAAAWGDNGYGHVISKSAGNLVIIKNSKMSGNSTGSASWSIASINAKKTIIEKLDVIDNSGGLAIGATTAPSTVTIKDSLFDTNTDSGLVLVGNYTTKDVLKGEISQTIIQNTGKSGLRVEPWTQITIKDSEIKENLGSGIYCGDCRLLVNRVTVEGNQSISGGGLYAIDWPTNIGYPDTPRVVVKNSTFSNNSADEYGGAIASFAAAKVDLVSSTIYDNSAGLQGGGIHVSYPAGKPAITLRSSIVAGNEASGSSSLAESDCSDNTNGTEYSIYSFDDNIIGYDSGSTVCNINFGTAQNDQTMPPPLNPQLENLAYNGGFGRTHEPMPSSPAVDPLRNISECLDIDGSSLLSIDQNRDFRPVNGKCDIGSVEFRY